jgi:hypothetical protein
MFDRQFGGSTPLGIVPGRWLGPDGMTIQEPMQRIEVSVPKPQIPTFEKIAKLIGRATKQKVMYVVINYQAQSRFLQIENFDEEDDSNPSMSAG